MKYPPTLTPEQEKTIADAKTEQLELWMNEIYPGMSINKDLDKLYHYLNEVRNNDL